MEYWKIFICFALLQGISAQNDCDPPESFACPEPSGSFPFSDYVCCSNYYICVGSSHFIAPCPIDTVFDPETRKCTSPDQCNPLTTVPETTSTVTETSATAESTSDGTESTTGETTTTTAETESTSEGTESTQGETTTTGESESTSDGTESTTGETTTTTGESESTSEGPESTTDESQTPVETTTANPGETEDPCLPLEICLAFGTFPIPCECSQSFYQCPIPGNPPNILQCPDGQLFDPAIKTCVPENEASCFVGTTPIETTTAETTTGSDSTTVTDTETTTATTTPSVFICPEPDGDFPVPDQQCSQNYYTCESDVPTLSTCPDDQIFDPVNRECSAESSSCTTTTETSTTEITTTSDPNESTTTEATETETTTSKPDEITTSGTDETTTLGTDETSTLGTDETTTLGTDDPTNETTDSILEEIQTDIYIIAGVIGGVGLILIGGFIGIGIAISKTTAAVTALGSAATTTGLGSAGAVSPSSTTLPSVDELSSRFNVYQPANDRPRNPYNGLPRP